ncbi:hypothetical protein ACFONI_11610 [Aeromonas media]|uniref:hypothetical protein n=1 Tax=Aeromonas media TaxID=651 RepID=UPI00361BEB21
MSVGQAIYFYLRPLSWKEGNTRPEHAWLDAISCLFFDMRPVNTPFGRQYQFEAIQAEMPI